VNVFMRAHYFWLSWSTRRGGYCGVTLCRLLGRKSPVKRVRQATI